MNFTKDQLEDYISNLIFSVNKLNAFDVAEKYGLDIEERDRIRNVYWPIIVVNSFTLQELKEYLLLRKQRFTEVNGFFDLELFMGNENLGVEILKSELNEFIRLTPLQWHSVQGTQFIEYRTSLDSSEKTLLITDKNQVQLKFYFKTLLFFLNEIDEVLTGNKSLPKESKSDDIYKKALQTIEDNFNAFLKDGWETVFHNQNDYKNFADSLANLFCNQEKELELISIKTKKRTKTQTGKALNRIFQKCADREILKGYTDFFKVIRQLDSFKDLTDYQIVTVLQK